MNKQKEQDEVAPVPTLVRAKPQAIATKAENPGLDSKVELIKRTVCKGSTDEEFQLFMHACKMTGLDPFMKQIYAVKRGGSMCIQTSIDGFRLIAERTGKYSPGKEATFSYNKDGKIISATSYVKKMTSDGTWHEVSSSCYYDEYVQVDRDGRPSQFWKRMPHVMLAKCAESAALRKAFPAELSGLYTQEEMAQSVTDVQEAAPTSVVQDSDENDILTKEEAEEIDNMMERVKDKEYITNLTLYVRDRYNVDSTYELRKSQYRKIIHSLKTQLEKEDEQRKLA